MFIDEVRVFARAGHGGRGCVAFAREAYRPKGGPSGGNGGKGGDVILMGCHDLNNLIAQYYVPNLIAQKGQHGMGKGMDGKAGSDLLVKAPCGTLVWRLRSRLPAPIPPNPPLMEDSETEAPQPDGQFPPATMRHHNGETALELDLTRGEDAVHLSVAPSLDDRELVADLVEHGQRFVLCKGGRGGLGNRNFATPTRQTPRFAQPGEPGEEGQFLFELRLMAEVGLVGYPNAGKSTLLTAISRARPKIAPYPFTTLHPQIGIVEYQDFERLTVCDVPGLIQGAHRNAGLGHKFLRHIQRCKVLAILIDMSGVDGRHPWDDYHNLLRELELFNPDLAAKPRLVVANKMDEPTAASNLRKFKRRIPRITVLPIAAAFNQGIDRFKKSMRGAVAQTVATWRQPSSVEHIQ